MKTIIQSILLSIFLGITTPVIADSFQDANDAYEQKDYVTALKIFRELADQEVALAQFNLALMYSNGQGVPQDYIEAFKWYRLAAEQGDTYAQYNLGVMYANGQGVAQDYVQAHMWYNLTSANDTDVELHNLATNNRDSLASEMTSAQIEEAQKLAREWEPK